jgi:hypothetical protein
MFEENSSLTPNLAAYYRPPKVSWELPSLPPVSVQDATLAAYYREPKVNWKIPISAPDCPAEGTKK